MLFVVGMSWGMFWAIAVGLAFEPKEVISISTQVDQLSIHRGIEEIRPSEDAKLQTTLVEAQKKALEKAQDYKEVVQGYARAYMSKPTSKCPLHENCLKNPPTYPPAASNRPFSSIQPLIFVSSSMPKSSLQQLAFEAKNQGARLLIRGMVNNSMKETALLAKELNYPLDIDPKLFERFNIHKIPAFAIPQEVKGQTQWKLIHGNITLSYAQGHAQGKSINTEKKQQGEQP